MFEDCRAVDGNVGMEKVWRGIWTSWAREGSWVAVIGPSLLAWVWEAIVLVEEFGIEDVGLVDDFCSEDEELDPSSIEGSSGVQSCFSCGRRLKNYGV
jgi:hypothetical protein